MTISKTLLNAVWLQYCWKDFFFWSGPEMLGNQNHTHPGNPVQAEKVGVDEKASLQCRTVSIWRDANLINAFSSKLYWAVEGKNRRAPQYLKWDRENELGMAVWNLMTSREIPMQRIQAEGSTLSCNAQLNCQVRCQDVAGDKSAAGCQLMKERSVNSCLTLWSRCNIWLWKYVHCLLQ